MSFLSKFRGGQDKGKASKKEWTPPKIPLADDPLPDHKEPASASAPLESASSHMSAEIRDSFGRKPSISEMENKENSAMTKEDDPETSQTGLHSARGGGISQFSFIMGDSTTKSDEAGWSSGVQKKSAFSFISDTSKDRLSALSSEENPRNQISKQVESSKVAAVPLVAMLKEATPKKKKKKVLRPGYGNIGGPPSEIYQKEQRSSSTSSASETRSEGFADEDIKEDSSQTSSLSDGSLLPRSSEDMTKNKDTAFAFISDGSRKNDADDDEPKSFDIGEIKAEMKLSSKDLEAGIGGRTDIVTDQGNEMNDEIDDSDGVNVSDGKEAESTSLVDEENIENAENATTVVSIDTPRESYELSNDEEGFVEEGDVPERPSLAKDVDSERDTTKHDDDIINISDQNEPGTSEQRDNEEHEDNYVPVDILSDLKEILTESSRIESSLEVSYELSLDQDEKTEIYLETLESREKSLRDQLSSLKNTQLETLQNIKKSFNSKQIVSEQIKELQEEQSNAVSKDDFALAEKINQRIDQKQNELENLKFKHPLLDEKIIQLVDQCNECLKNQMQECSYLQNQFQDIIKSEEENLKKHVNQSDTSEYKARLKINEDKAKLDREMGHISLDKEHLKKSETQLDEEIHERTKTYEDDKNQLLDQRRGILNEIEDLEERLKILRGKESDLNSKIDVIDSKINDIVLDFSPRLENIRKEKSDILEKENDVSAKLENLTKLEDELKEKQELEQNFEKRCKQNIDMLTEKISSVKKIEEEIGKEQIDFESIIDVDQLRFSRTEEHRKLQIQVKKLTDELNSENCKVLETSVQATRLKKVMNDIEARVGELEKEKALAVSGRNFKVAKRITEERNSLITDGQQSQNKLKELEEEIRERDSVIDRLKTELLESKNLLEKEETDLDKKISSSLLDIIGKMNAFRRQKSSLWIMPFITFEISTCKAIIEDIHENYGWPLPEIISEEEDDASLEDNESELPSDAVSDATRTGSCHETESTEIMKKKLEALELNLQQAVDDEDYDQADEINMEIEKYKDLLAGEQ